jgi:DNA-binding NtrC family response regulator
MATMTAGQTGKLLVAGHSAGLRGLVSDYLSGLGHAVIQANTPDDALAAVRREHPHLVLLDLRWPEACGADVLVQMRREHPELDVIPLTGNRDLTVARAAGSVAAFDLDRLDRAVGAGLRSVRCSTFGQPAVMNGRTPAATIS